MNIAVQIRRKAFPSHEDATARVVFSDLSLRLAAGETCAILGPSGIGKTSLLNILAGLDGNFVGSVTGRPESIGYLFQSPRLLPWLTARQNIELVLGGNSARAGDWLSRVGLAAAADVYPQRLSLGMARRVALARALAVRPRLLLLDEPFSALDAATAAIMQALLRREIAILRPVTLLVTHDPREAEALADRMVSLAGSPARIVEDRRRARAPA